MKFQNLLLVIYLANCYLYTQNQNIMDNNLDFFKIGKISHELPRQGGLLVAEPFLGEIYFRRSCICLAEYAEDSPAVGVVLNHPTGILLSDVIKDIRNKQPIPIYCGGPLSMDRLLFIHDIKGLPNATRIDENLFFNGDLDEVVEWIDSGAQINGHIKFFVGYSGWDIGQLEHEMASGVWAATSRIPQGTYFLNQDENYWEECVRRLGENFRSWLLCPEMPMLN